MGNSDLSPAVGRKCDRLCLCELTCIAYAHQGAGDRLIARIYDGYLGLPGKACVYVGKVEGPIGSCTALQMLVNREKEFGNILAASFI